MPDLKKYNMKQEEIEAIRLALDTEIEHKDYAKHNLAAKTILNYHEILNERQTLPIHLVSKSFKCCKGTDKCDVQCDDCNMVYNF